MLAAPPALAMVQVTAGIGAEMLDAQDLLAQVLLRRRLKNMEFEHGPADCKGAGGWKATVEPDG